MHTYKLSSSLGSKSLVITSCIAIHVFARGTVGVPADPIPIAQATVSSEIPTEVVDGSGAPLPIEVSALPIAFFDDFSWRSFIALNWPAVADVRGEADKSKAIGAEGPRVWETWKADYEAFQPGGVPPTEWASFDAITPCSDVSFSGGGAMRVIAAFSKFATMNQATFGAPGNPLVAQNRTYTRYEVRMNRLEFEFIRDHKLYLRSTLRQLRDPLRFTPGSIEVKAAWKELKDDELAGAKGKYYIIQALVQNPINKDLCEQKNLALVGFHIVQKTPLRPQWVWSSFEHNDNVPDPNRTGPASFSYNDPQKNQELLPPNPPVPLSTSNPPKTDPDPMQVIRVLPIHPDTTKANARYQAALAGTIWANYHLVVTQWPTRTKDPSLPFPEDILGNPFPPRANATAVGNTTMETYFQDGATCMECHNAARLRKTDLVWFVQLRAFPPDEEVFITIASDIQALMNTAKAH